MGTMILLLSLFCLLSVLTPPLQGACTSGQGPLFNSHTKGSLTVNG